MTRVNQLFDTSALEPTLRDRIKPIGKEAKEAAGQHHHVAYVRAKEQMVTFNPSQKFLTIPKQPVFFFICCLRFKKIEWRNVTFYFTATFDSRGAHD